jgi:hypothetical protein
MEEKDLMVEQRRILYEDAVKTPFFSLPAPKNYFFEPYTGVFAQQFRGISLHASDPDTPVRYAGNKQLHLPGFLRLEARLPTYSWWNPRYKRAWGPLVGQAGLQSLIAPTARSKNVLKGSDDPSSKLGVAAYHEYIPLFLLGSMGLQILLML